ncbi:MAG: spore germination protein, partial [Clostridia bacterium]|nr:spore germination protein [Clostridia bacterium]
SFPLPASGEGVPFPALVEALFLELLFETVREASIRLPPRAGADPPPLVGD